MDSTRSNKDIGDHAPVYRNKERHKELQTLF